VVLLEPPDAVASPQEPPGAETKEANPENQLIRIERLAGRQQEAEPQQSIEAANCKRD
jgi:hypothetical protein